MRVVQLKAKIMQPSQVGWGADSLMSLLVSVPCDVLYTGLLESSLVSVLNAAVKFAYVECNIISDLCEADMEVLDRQNGIKQH